MLMSQFLPSACAFLPQPANPSADRRVPDFAARTTSTSARTPFEVLACIGLPLVVVSMASKSKLGSLAVGVRCFCLYRASVSLGDRVRVWASQMTAAPRCETLHRSSSICSSWLQRSVSPSHRRRPRPRPSSLARTFRSPSMDVHKSSVYRGLSTSRISTPLSCCAFNSASRTHRMCLYGITVFCSMAARGSVYRPLLRAFPTDRVLRQFPKQYPCSIGESR